MVAIVLVMAGEQYWGPLAIVLLAVVVVVSIVSSSSRSTW